MPAVLQGGLDPGSPIPSFPPVGTTVPVAATLPPASR